MREKDGEGGKEERGRRGTPTLCPNKFAVGLIENLILTQLELKARYKNGTNGRARRRRPPGS